MAIIQCKNDHYYDNIKNTTCPYCQKLSGDIARTGNPPREQQTVSMSPEPNYDEGPVTEIYGEAVNESDKTIRIFSYESTNLLTVGWLVCTSGPVKGKSYVIHSGRNFAGRDLYMDIVLSDDLQLSRKKHFSIVYEPRKNCFYILPGAGLTYLNGKQLADQNKLTEGDRITAGKSAYIFVPFCKEGRAWEAKE